MKAFFKFAVVLLLGGVTVQAALIPYYRMDSYALLSDAVIYCQELEIKHHYTKHSNWTDDQTSIRCEVIKSFKGDLNEGQIIIIEYPIIFQRHLMTDQGEYQIDSAGKVSLKSPPKEIGTSRALVFLKRSSQGGPYEPMTVKLVLASKVLQFGQFLNNPGPLVLAEQKPENITLKPEQVYGEQEFLEDVELSMQKSQKLKKPVRVWTFDALK